MGNLRGRKTYFCVNISIQHMSHIPNASYAKVIKSKIEQQVVHTIKYVPCPISMPTYIINVVTRPVSGGLRAMKAEWISALAGGRAPFSYLFSSFLRVCVLLRKAKRRRLPEGGIKVSPSSPRSGDACSIIGGRVEVCLRRICLW